MTIVFLAQACLSVQEPAALQYSFTIWDWETTYRDLSAFRQQVDAVVGQGFNLLELGAAWADAEITEGQYDFSLLEERVAYAVSKGLALRLRLNMVRRPPWYHAEMYQFPDGSDFPHMGGYPSIFNAANRARQHAFAEALARHFAGRGFTYTPGFSVHMEVKFGDWIGYEPSARSAFRQWLAGRYGTVSALNEAWKTAYNHFEEIDPPVLRETSGEPFLRPLERDWIAFREHGLADWVAGFAAHVRRGDPTAKISVPLGESFRRQSAAFANLGYWTYSRAADEIVHSYDFFWHGPQHTEAARVATATMIGIAQKPTIFEIDGPYLFSDHEYTPDLLIQVARAALETGASGIQVSNWGSSEITEHVWMRQIGDMIREQRTARPQSPTPRVLYYVSKWQQYAFREPTDWLYDRQFALWHRLREAGITTRIVSDENVLHEEITGDYLILPCARVIDEPIKNRIRALSYGMRTVADEKPGVYTPLGEKAGSFGAKVAVSGKPFTEDKREVTEILGNLSSKRLRVGVVQFRSTPNISENTRRMIQFLREAAEHGGRIVVFPEMALTGYSKSETFAQTLDWSAVDQGISELRSAARELGLYVIFGGPSRKGKRIYCSAYALSPQGEVIDRYEKIYLAGEKWASPGRHVSMFEIEGVRCGTFICHDERYPPLVQLRALAGAQLFFYISCESGLEAEYKIEPYRAQIQARAVENGVFIVHANTPAATAPMIGADASHGHSRIVAPDGNVLGEMPTHVEGLFIRDIDLSYAQPKGFEKALVDGPLAAWMKKGVRLVQDNGRLDKPTTKR